MEFIARLDIEMLSSELYRATTSHDGQQLDTDAGFTSISAALESAAGITGPIRGFEVAYQGIVVGTYPREQLKASAKTVADAAIDTVKALAP